MSEQGKPVVFTVLKDSRRQSHAAPIQSTFSRRPDKHGCMTTQTRDTNITVSDNWVQAFIISIRRQTWWQYPSYIFTRYGNMFMYNKAHIDVTQHLAHEAPDLQLFPVLLGYMGKFLIFLLCFRHRNCLTQNWHCWKEFFFKNIQAHSFH